MNKYFKRISGVSDVKYIIFGNPKVSLMKILILLLHLIIVILDYLNAKIRAIFSGSCLKQANINTYTHGAIINIYIAYKLNTILHNFDPALENYLFGAVKLTKNADIVQIFRLWYWI